MNKSALILGSALVVGAAIGGYCLLGPCCGSSATELEASVVTAPTVQPKKKKDKKGAAGYVNALHEMRANPATGEISRQDYERARTDAYNFIEAAGNFRGVLNLEWEEVGPDNIGGRTRTLLIDRNNPKRMYTGGVAGGLWISDNAGASWTAYPNDTLGGVGVVSLTQTANGDIYAGTGELFSVDGTNGNSSGFPGMGIWKSSDGGQTFKFLQATSGNQFLFINVMESHPTNGQVAYAGTNSGVYITEDGGQSWQKRFVLNGSVVDIKVLPNGTGFIASSGLFYRGDVNQAGNFQNMSGQDGFPAGGNGNMRITYSKNNPDHVYVISADNGFGPTRGQTRWVYQSKDGGQNWSQLLDGAATNLTGDQGWWDIAIYANADEPERLYTGGQLSVYQYNKGWFPVSNWFTNSSFDPHHVHADHHVIVGHPTNPNIMYIGTDGGVFRTTEALLNGQLPTFNQLNKGYNVTQCYGIAGGLDKSALLGSQDNGSIFIDLQGNNPSTGREVSGGDGGYCDISKNKPNALFVSAQDGSIRRSSNYGASVTSYLGIHIDTVGDGEPDCGSPFITKTRLADIPNTESGVIAMSTDCGVWIAYDVLNFQVNPTFYKVAPNISGTASTFEWSADAGTLYFGTSTGRVYRVDGVDSIHNWKYTPAGAANNPKDDIFHLDSNGVSVTLIANFGTYVTSLALDLNDQSRLVATTGTYSTVNHVYLSEDADTTSGASSFVSIQGDLPNSMPVYSSVIDFYTGTIIIGTDFGMFTAEKVGAAWRWDPDNSGMPRTPTWMLRQVQLDSVNSNCYQILAGTHSRGIWRTVTTVDQGNGCNLSLSAPVVTSNISEMELYPNPASEVARLAFDLDKRSPVDLTIYNMTGLNVYHRNFGTLSAGSYTNEIDIRALQTGNYIVMIATDHGRESVQLVVTR